MASEFARSPRTRTSRNGGVTRVQACSSGTNQLLASNSESKNRRPDRHLSKLFRSRKCGPIRGADHVARAVPIGEEERGNATTIGDAGPLVGESV